MRRLRTPLALLLVFVLTLTACADRSTLGPDPTQDPVLVAAQTTYIDPLYRAGLLYDFWEEEHPLPSDRLLQYYHYGAFQIKANEAGWRDGIVVTIPAEEVEEHLARYFLFDTDTLRTDKAYQAREEAYGFLVSGIGSGPGVTVIEVVEEGDTLTITCEDEGKRRVHITIQKLPYGDWLYLAGSGIQS